MRTFTLVFFASLASFSSFAQNFEIGAYYLPQQTSISNSISDKGDPVYKNEITFAGGGGVSFTYWIKSIGFQTGIAYLSHNQKFVSKYYYKKDPDSTGTVYGKRRLDYFKVPVLLAYSKIIPYKRDSRISFSAFAGPQFGYLIKGDGGVVAYEHYQFSDFYDLPPASSDYYNKFVIDVVLGAGLDFHITKELTINTAVRFDYSLTDVENKNAPSSYKPNALHYEMGSPERNKSHSQALGLLLGISYSFGGDHLLNPSKRW